MENQEKLNLGTRIAQWIQKRKKILLTILAVLVVVLIVLGIVNGLSSAKNRKAAANLLEFEELYSQWNNATTEEREGFVQDIRNKFEEIENEYSGTYAHQRGLFMMGDLYFANEKWEDSLDKYLSLAGMYSKSYLAPVALYNAAAAAEELGNNEKAVENYQRISAEYAESSLAPRSLFSVGRLQEQKSIEQALSAYNSLIELYPQSNWTKLARSRIIELNISK